MRLTLFSYYGGKKRSSTRYPPPVFDHIIEPFAGAAGYAHRYHNRRVTLIEKNPKVAAIWRYLIAVSPAEVRRLPCVYHADELPSWVPQEARWWLGFRWGTGDCGPRNHASMRASRAGVWSEHARGICAEQVAQIKHWRILEGSYEQATREHATWYVDPPYDNKAGERYPCGREGLDYQALGAWCRDLPGQVLVCENEGATWLPFEPLHVQQGSQQTHRTEVLYHQLHGVRLRTTGSGSN
jgi:hypothetical protein